MEKNSYDCEHTQTLELKLKTLGRSHMTNNYKQNQ